MIYWRGGDYVGIGPGAHGRLTLLGQRHATMTELFPSAWLDQTRRTGSGELGRDALGARDHATEYLMMSLRTSEGLDLARYDAITDAPLNMLIVKGLVEHRLLDLTPDALKATRSGRAVLNSIITALLPDS
jgi:oxygen-independent coproporphyrinogen-3 oxidase